MNKFGRYTKVAGTAAGVAAGALGEKFFGSENMSAANARRLRMALGNLKGPVMKIAQLLATIPEALPPEYARELTELQMNAPPMGKLFVRRRMKSELGPDWEKRFQSFDENAAAAASLGQVHKAIGLDGAELACKLQYPDMEGTIEADLRQLKFFFAIFEMVDKSIRTDKIQKELAERLLEELDYRREARSMAWYHFMLRDEADINVPRTHSDLSTDKLLTMDWLQGEHFISLKSASQGRRDDMALKLFRAWYLPLYNYGVIHGDPHPGNYTVTKDDKLNLLDFGCVRTFAPPFVGGVINLYRALENEDRNLAVHAFETWGFKNLKNEVIDILMLWAGFLYGPLLDDRKRVIGETKGKPYGRDTAMQVHKELKRLGGVEVPREFVFIDRAALGLGSVFIQLQAKINWHRLFNEMIDGFDEKTLAKKQTSLLKDFGNEA